MRGGVACPGAIGVAGLVPGLEGIEGSSDGEGKSLVALIIGSSGSSVVRGAFSLLRSERDRSESFRDGIFPLGVAGGEYFGVSELDDEFVLFDFADTRCRLGGGGSSVPISSSASSLS